MVTLLLLPVLLSEPSAIAQEGAALVYSASARRPLTVDEAESGLTVHDAYGLRVDARLLAELQGHDLVAEVARSQKRRTRAVGWGLFSGGTLLLLSGAAGTSSWNANTQVRGRYSMLIGTGVLAVGTSMVVSKQPAAPSNWYSDDDIRTGVAWINAQPLSRWTSPVLTVLQDPRRGYRVVDESGVSWTARDLGMTISDPRLSAIARADRRELATGIVRLSVGAYLLTTGTLFTIVGATVEPFNGLWAVGGTALVAGSYLVTRGVTQLRHAPKRHVAAWYTEEEAREWVAWINSRGRAPGRPRDVMQYNLGPTPSGIGVQATW